MLFSANNGNGNGCKETPENLAPPVDPNIDWLEIRKTP